MPEYITYFIELLGKDLCFYDEKTLIDYSYDHTENLKFLPSIVLKPRTVEQISQIVQYCNQHKIPITPRAGGTGQMGGALPIHAGVIISIEKLNKIIDIDTQNFQATVEAGVINFHLQQALEPLGFLYGPDPSSWGSSFIGGNIATNAGGLRAVKYGVTSASVLNLEVVLPNGDIIWTGANTLKNSTGYNLTQLFIGSEGTLGIVTKAILKIIPKPKTDITILIPFHNLEDSAKAVTDIFKNGLFPCSLELMERNALEQAMAHLEDNSIPLQENVQAHLLVSFDGESQEELMPLIEKTISVLENYTTEEIYFADNEMDKSRLWQMRRKIAEIVKANGYTIEEDTVVPRAKLPDLINFVHQLALKNNLKVVCYGHAGDGNLHIRFNHSQYKNSYNNPFIQAILYDLFQYIYSLGGTISGEHGIGLIQQPYLPIVFTKANLEIQKNIKNAIDPNNIMNPGKVLNNN
ncbi:FAD-binding oxidoreductase [Apibacter adventoris]|uniref:FAD-binding oxidoreductase n=1 Tax=Apibacter adventoris TaxID=1679466 RepID=A0A2S8A8F3_9FLAO|nr:FAD-linked oxidase C-terminal domain-containing protein [Apibacter adventoris]PQL90857.1 FAD-binding oxidoreductase [Apibacter adventoris]